MALPWNAHAATGGYIGVQELTLLPAVDLPGYTPKSFSDMTAYGDWNPNLSGDQLSLSGRVGTSDPFNFYGALHDSPALHVETLMPNVVELANGDPAPELHVSGYALGVGSKSGPQYRSDLGFVVLSGFYGAHLFQPNAPVTLAGKLSVNLWSDGVAYSATRGYAVIELLDQQLVYNFAVPDHGGMVDAREIPFSITATSSDSFSKIGQFNIRLSLEGSTTAPYVASSVPETETSLMLVSGLGILGVVGRRKQRSLS